MELNGYQLYDYIVSGARKIIINQKYLNSINVFPVADGDTGSNLAFTMNNIIRYAERDKSASKTLNSIAKHALDASYGNSGTIVASYLKGLATESTDKERLSVCELVNNLSRSVQYAYNSIATPKEGTILTVMREWGDFLKNNYNDKFGLEMLLSSSLRYLSEVVNNTKDQLRELREANVVDAGAKGFVYFVEGIYEFLSSGYINEEVESYDIPIEMLDLHQNINFRYCTEFDLEPNEKFKVKKVTKDMLSFGDSLIVNDREEYYKMHVHTDDPEKVALYLRNYGKITGAKVDDMQIQYNVLNNRKSDIALITDSIADLPTEFIEEKQIFVMPLQMIADGEIYLDRTTITTKNTFSVLKDSDVYPTSSQPTDSYIRKTLEYLLQHYDQILGVFISSKMSGTFSKVKTIAEEISHERIKILDSRANSGSQGLIVRQAALAIEKSADFEEVVQLVESVIPKMKIFVEIPDLSYAVKSGRVPSIVGKVADLFNLRVIISIDKEGNGSVAKDRSLKKKIRKIVKEESIKEYAIIHSADEETLRHYVDYATEVIGFPPIFSNNVSAVITALVGKDSIGIAYEVN